MSALAWHLRVNSSQVDTRTQMVDQGFSSTPFHILLLLLELLPLSILLILRLLILLLDIITMFHNVNIANTTIISSQSLLTNPYPYLLLLLSISFREGLKKRFGGPRP